MPSVLITHLYSSSILGMLMYIACLCPNLVSVHFYAIPILHFKFPKFFIYLLVRRIYKCKNTSDFFKVKYVLDETHCHFNIGIYALKHVSTATVPALISTCYM